MKQKHLDFYIQQVQELSKLSTCSRNRFGALIIDPVHNCIIMNGYNGTGRGGTALCGGASCLRDTQRIKSGHNLAVGCNHAEANAIANCSRIGVSALDKWMIVNGEPCLACAKLIHQSGISKVLYIENGYSSTEGIEYLKSYHVSLESLERSKSC
jgi:dCMP deaminase